MNSMSPTAATRQRTGCTAQLKEKVSRANQTYIPDSKSQQQQAQIARDTRRVLQVLLPSLPPPAIDICLNTVFASSSLGGVSQARAAPSSRFRLRRMDSGEFGQLELENLHAPSSWQSRSECKRFSDTSNLVFQYDCPLIEAPEPRAQRGWFRR